MKLRDPRSGIARHRFPSDPWRLVETDYSAADLGTTETLFSVGNGYIGMRANPAEGRDAHTHGTFLNGFHETWPIHHAESAHGFAKTGQTIINVPDAKLLKLYVDDEPLRLGNAELLHYERVLDFRTGISHRDLLWRTPGNKKIRVRTERMVCLEHRHLAVLSMTVTVEEGSAPVVVSSQLLNRQDGEDEYHVSASALGEGDDPRQARKFDQRVLEPLLQEHQDPDDPAGGTVVLGYRAMRSKMTMVAGYRHTVSYDGDYELTTDLGEDLARSVFTFDVSEGESVRIDKFVSYHSSTGVPVQELSNRAIRTLDRAVRSGAAALAKGQREWLDGFWATSDIAIEGDPEAQQALRWNLFHLAQASARTHENGIAAKAVTAGGYDGHYFWDTEIYVLPFLAYTNPEAARKLLRFRHGMLDAARMRAAEVNQDGALYPWRTINGEEASAYYAAGTAQYHINAAIIYALERYTNASGDLDFLVRQGAQMAVESARMYEDLGFYGHDALFHIHGVTGPDEYTTVVNDNTYTNTLARFTLRFAAQTVELMDHAFPDAYEALVRATGVTEEDVDAWNRAADAMYIPYDERLGIHPQDASFLSLEPWDFAGTPPENYPLLLNYHPLVIYRHQVTKQADVVLAMFLRGEHFDVATKRRNFDYYDPITTGDSSLSACVQSLVAAQVGYDDLAWKYFDEALLLDLADTHRNTADGVHIANAGGVWAAVVHGFAGMVDDGAELRFAPRIPQHWKSYQFHLTRHGATLTVIVNRTGARVAVNSGGPVPIRSGTSLHHVEAGSVLDIEMANLAQSRPAAT